MARGRHDLDARIRLSGQVTAQLAGPKASAAVLAGLPLLGVALGQGIGANPWHVLTATPAKHTFGFFHQNLVMEYPHERAVADGVNVDFEVYRIHEDHGRRFVYGSLQPRTRHSMRSCSLTGRRLLERGCVSFLSIPTRTFDDRLREMFSRTSTVHYQESRNRRHPCTAARRSVVPQAPSRSATRLPDSDRTCCPAGSGTLLHPGPRS